MQQFVVRNAGCEMLRLQRYDPVKIRLARSSIEIRRVIRTSSLCLRPAASSTTRWDNSGSGKANLQKSLQQSIGRQITGGLLCATR